MSSLSIINIVVTLYAKILQNFVHFPKHPDRDRFILSKGHAASAVYSLLAARGYIPKSVLERYNENNSQLLRHLSHLSGSGIELSTGSLDHGLSIGVEMSLNTKIEQKYTVYMFYWEIENVTKVPFRRHLILLVIINLNI